MSNDTGPKVSLAVDARCELGECPVWDDRQLVLLWVDITVGSIHRYDPVSGAHDWASIDSHIGSVALREDGGLVLATRDGFAIADHDGGGLELVAAVEASDPSTRMNDGKCDRRGRFWAGTMAYDLAPGRGALYCLLDGDDRRAERRVSEVSISNGLAWSGDDRTLYYVDSPSQRIDAFAFDLETGRLGERRHHISIPPEAGMPDGLTIDDDEHLWIALWGGGALRRYRPDGRLDLEVAIPASKVTSCTFGGADRSTIFVTTAREDLDEVALETQPYAGGLFSFDAGVTGPPTDRFRTVVDDG